MRNAKFLSLLSVIALGACSHYSEDLSSLDKQISAPAQLASVSPQNIAPAAGTGSSAFMQDLAREYYALARYENDRAYDYKASKAYTGKAMAAQQGRLVVPSKVTAFSIPADRAAELTEARGALITALKTINTPENAAPLARAQARYECWLERAEEAAEETHYSACRDEFQQSMAALTMPAAGAAATTYDIGFAANSAILDPASETTVDLVAQFLNDPKNASYSASLTGFSAAAGEFADNVMTARVAAVRDALVAKGVAADRLKPLVAPAAAAAADLASKVQVALIAPDPSAANPYNSTTTKFVPVEPRPVQ